MNLKTYNDPVHHKKKTFLLSLKEAVAMVMPWHCLRVSSQIRTLSIAHIVNRKIDIQGEKSND